MSLVLYMVTGLVLIIMQTTIVQGNPVLHGIHDLPLLLAVYAALLRPPRESVPHAIAMGFVMDGLSGGPIGLYVTAYFWICICIIWLMTFLHVRSRLLLPFVYFAAALLENLILVGGLILLVPGAGLPRAALSAMAIPAIWAVFTGPVFVVSVDAVHRKVAFWYGEYLASRKNGYDPAESV